MRNNLLAAFCCLKQWCWSIQTRRQQSEGRIEACSHHQIQKSALTNEPGKLPSQLAIMTLHDRIQRDSCTSIKSEFLYHLALPSLALLSLILYFWVTSRCSGAVKRGQQTNPMSWQLQFQKHFSKVHVFFSRVMFAETPCRRTGRWVIRVWEEWKGWKRKRRGQDLEGTGEGVEGEETPLAEGLHLLDPPLDPNNNSVPSGLWPKCRTTTLHCRSLLGKSYDTAEKYPKIHSDGCSQFCDEPSLRITLAEAQSFHPFTKSKNEITA